MTGVFDAYARYYDLLYRDKDYAGEADFSAALVREHAPHVERFLELGCGTGAHAEHLARMGYSVRGIDRSEAMIKGAAARVAALTPEVAGRLTFGLGDVRTLRTGETYDAVISLFHVMSYQTSDADLAAAFDTAARHLAPGGVFLFDYWYGPAVLAQKPEGRVRRLEDEDIRVVRAARPTMRSSKNVVEVDYTVSIEVKATGQKQEVRESHAMRYLFLPEIERFLGAGTWQGVRSFAWLEREAPTEKDWSACTLAIRR